jgi:hypothetical protein
LDLQDLIPLLSAALMVAVALWLLWLKFASRVNRAFATFLVLRAGILLTNRLIVADVSDSDFWSRISQYLFLAILPSLAYFLIAYLLPWREVRTKVVALGTLLAGVGLEGVYVWDHCLDICRTSTGTLVGPLSLLRELDPLAYALAALWIASQAKRASGMRQEAGLLMALAFLLNSAVDATVEAGLVLAHGFDAAASAVASVDGGFVVAAQLAALVPSALALRLFLAESNGPRRVGAALGFVAALATGALVGIEAGTPTIGSDLVFLLGMWRLVLPLLVAFALVRHQLFDVEVKVRWTIARSVVAIFFLAAFLVASQLGQNFLNQQFGWEVGGVAAGLLVFALTPLQRLGESTAHILFPQQREADGHTLGLAEKRRLYEDQLRLAWTGGTISARERRMLNHLRDQLRLSADDAADIESRILQ